MPHPPRALSLPVFRRGRQAWPLRAAALLELAVQFSATKEAKAIAATTSADAARRWPRPVTPGGKGKARREKGKEFKLRVGYLSADYRHHVMAFLTRGLFEQHAGAAQHVQIGGAPAQVSRGLRRRGPGRCIPREECQSLCDAAGERPAVWLSGP